MYVKLSHIHKGFIILALLVGQLEMTFGQEVKSKYPCRSEITYDFLVGGATYSGTVMDREYELQMLLNESSNKKEINGRHQVKFVVDCDGSTSEIVDDFEYNTLNNDLVTAFLRNMAEGLNWNPAVHREERVPHRISIFIEVKRGRIVTFKVP